MKAGKTPIPEKLRALFWDVDQSKLDLARHGAFIIERVLNMGDQQALAWLRTIVSDEQILQVVKGSRRLTRKTALCWKNIYNLSEDEMRCFGTSSIRQD
ncbi:MAG: DUF6922 domain-containing protein, partial [Thermovirgaceae bacterium]